MKRFTLFVSSLLIAATMYAQAPNQNQDISKVLQISTTDHDFGKIAYGKPVEFDVVIKNISNDSISISNVKVTCGCTTPKYQANKAFGPGETVNVTLGFNGFADGHFQKSADIFFSNGLSQQIRFHGQGYKVETPAPANGAVQKMKSGSK